MPDDKDINQIENEEKEELFEDSGGYEVPFDELDESDQSYYESGAAEEGVDQSEYHRSHAGEPDWDSDEGD